MNIISKLMNKIRKRVSSFPSCEKGCGLLQRIQDLEEELMETKTFLYYHKTLNACYGRDRQDMFRNNPSAIVQAHFKHSTKFLNVVKRKERRGKEND